MSRPATQAAGIDTAWPRPLATKERFSPQKPRRNKDVPREPAGRRLVAQDCDRRVAELHFRIAVLNGLTALGIPATEAVG